MKINAFSNYYVLAFAFVIMMFTACHSGNNQQSGLHQNDSVVTSLKDSVAGNVNGSTDSNASNGKVSGKDNDNKAESSNVLIYNFHVTNRCAGCIAIEDGTTKTLNTYFAAEVKQGRIKRQILNVDDDANAKIAEKYQAFGSGLFITRVFKGKETTADLTGEGFKYAKNKQEKFIEILKNKITEYLK